MIEPFSKQWLNPFQKNFVSIGPAMVAPVAYGLIKNNPTPQMQRQLVLLGKILQNLANHVRKC